MSDGHRYQHPDGTDAPRYVGVYREWKAEVDDEGYYETDVDPDVLREHGFLDAEETDDEPLDYTEIPPSLEDQTHDELKAVAKDLGLADEIDLRSKSSIREALEEHSGAE